MADSKTWLGQRTGLAQHNHDGTPCSGCIHTRMLKQLWPLTAKNMYIMQALGKLPTWRAGAGMQQAWSKRYDMCWRRVRCPTSTAHQETHRPAVRLLAGAESLIVPHARTTLKHTDLNKTSYPNSSLIEQTLLLRRSRIHKSQQQ